MIPIIIDRIMTHAFDIFQERRLSVGKIDNNKQMKRESLLDSAFSLFIDNGFNKTSISDIVNNAGVAKGTFYLYFKDKYDIRNKLIAHQSSQIFRKATKELADKLDTLSFEDMLIAIVDNIVNQLNDNQILLSFISKNLSWGVFKTALTTPSSDEDINFSEVYDLMLITAPYKIKDPEVMLFMIIELVSSTCYSAILYKDPCSLDELKPHLYETIRMIISMHRVKE